MSRGLLRRRPSGKGVNCLKRDAEEGPVCHSSTSLGLCVMPFQNGSSHIRSMELLSPNTESGKQIKKLEGSPVPEDIVGLTN